MKQKIIFFGSGIYTIPIIEVLKHHGLELIVTTENERDDKRYENEFYSYLKNQDVPFISTLLKNPSDRDIVRRINPTIGVLASYRAFLPADVLNIFPHGILNIHPSLLPKYKGPTPIQTTIFNGETETGTTVIKLDDQLDHGPIVAQGKIKLNGTETTQELKKTLFRLGAEMLDTLFQGDTLSQGITLNATPQDHSQESFTKKIEREDGHIDLSNPPDQMKLDRMIRAYYPWPGVWFKTKIKNQDLRVKLLPNHMIQVEGKKPMSYRDFTNGYAEGEEIVEKLTFKPLF